MSHKYKVRIYESGESDGCVDSGTIVMPVDRGFSLVGDSAEEIEKKLMNEVADNKLGAGRVYQICPPFGNPELIRSVAISSDVTMQTVFLDPALGLYSEFRRIRYPDPTAGVEKDAGVEAQESVPA